MRVNEYKEIDHRRGRVRESGSHMEIVPKVETTMSDELLNKKNHFFKPALDKSKSFTVTCPLYMDCHSYKFDSYSNINYHWI